MTSSGCDSLDWHNDKRALRTLRPHHDPHPHLPRRDPSLASVGAALTTVIMANRSPHRRHSHDQGVLACYLTHVAWGVLSCVCYPACRGDMRRPPLDDLRVPARNLE